MLIHVHLHMYTLIMLGLLTFESLQQELEAFQKDPNYVDVSTCICNDLLPDLGASPDGLIYHPDGTLEVLEVKC